MNNVLYVFIDESGNMDFSDKGTKHFVLAALTTLQPLVSSSALQSLKYSLLKENFGGQDFQNFHASEDRQHIRDRVFMEIAKMGDIHINWLWAEKSKTVPKYQKKEMFYSLLGGALTKYLIIKWNESDFEKIVIVFDKALTKKEQDVFYAEVKPKLKEIGKPYAIYFHHTVSDFNGQIADYIAWAKYVSLEKSEMRPINTLKAISQQDFNIFRYGK